jgi:hypothetical protein
MHNKKTYLYINGGDMTSCRGIGYIMVSNGTDSYAIRATTRATKGGVKEIGQHPQKFPVINLENCGCSFSHAYHAGPIDSDEFTVIEQAQFLHDQRMKLAEILGPVKFAEIDRCVCRAIREFSK